MGKTPDQIPASLNRYPSLIPLAAVQPHPPHTCLLHSPDLSIPLARNMGAEDEEPSRTTLHPHPALIRSSTFNLLLFLHHHPPQRGIKNSPLPKPTSVLSRLSYISESSSRCPPHSSISVVCVSEIDGQFPLLPVFSRDWNVDEPRTRWLEMTWMR
jgi:hypothetical protein